MRTFPDLCAPVEIAAKNPDKPFTPPFEKSSIASRLVVIGAEDGLGCTIAVSAGEVTDEPDVSDGTGVDEANRIVSTVVGFTLGVGVSV